MIRPLGKRYSEHWKRMGITQKEVDEKSGLSIFTISTSKMALQQELLWLRLSNC